MKSFEFNNVTVKPGEKQTVMIALPKLYDWTPMSMPVHILHGKEPGPVLCVTATVHGDEINGIEIIRRLMKRQMIKKLRGTLICAPLINVYGFLYQDRYLMDRRDLNRYFPGSKKGSLASRITDIITTQLIQKSDYIIDLHTGSLHRENLPQIRTNLDSKAELLMARAFNAPVIMHSNAPKGSLRQVSDSLGVPSMVYEAGEALRFDELSIRLGVRGILNVMDHLDMITLKKSSKAKTTSEETRYSYWVRAPYSGILIPNKRLGKKVSENELLGIIANPTSYEEHELKSAYSGIIVGQTNLPMIHAGAALFHIAGVDSPGLVEQNVDILQDDYGDTVYET